MILRLTFCLAFLCLAGAGFAQSDNAPLPWSQGGMQPTYNASPPLPYPPVNAQGILWEKHVWRVIDTREKINLVFRHPKADLFSILIEGIQRGEITAYSPLDDQLSLPIPAEDLDGQLNDRDSVTIINPETGQPELRVVTNVFDPTRIERWYVREVWYFDSHYSTMKCRILSIAPILTSYGEDNAVRYETPLFWVKYQNARQWLSSQPVLAEGNDHLSMSWEDLFEMRRFSSYITKDQNVLDQRLKDFTSGRDLLLESDKLETGIHHFEMDLWEY